MRQGRKALLKIADADKRILPDPSAVVYVDELGDGADTVLLRVWVLTIDYWNVHFEITEKAKLSFYKDGIEIYRNRLNVNSLSNAAMPQQQQSV